MTAATQNEMERLRKERDAWKDEARLKAAEAEAFMLQRDALAAQIEADAIVCDSYRQERDALAAHVAGLKPALEAFSNGLGYCCCGDPMDSHTLGSGHSPVDSGWYALDQYMGEAPTASLARHNIALLESLLDEAKDKQISTHLVVELKLDSLRRQAEEPPHG